MSNVLTLPVRGGPTPAAISDPASELARLAAAVTRTGLMSFETTDDLRQAIQLLGVYNARARHFIGRIDNPDSRSRLMAEADRIGALVEMAERKAADL